MKPCSIDDCEREIMARDLCTLHYQRWRKHGDPLKVIAPSEKRRRPRPPITERTCRVCALRGPVDLFAPKANICKPCSNAYKQSWTKTNPAKYREILARGEATRFRYELRRRAQRNGQDPDFVERYYRDHDGRCEICGRTPVGNERDLHIDHDHESGEFRGLLCNNCNGGLGRFKDSVESLAAAIRYLQRETPKARAAGSRRAA